MKETDCRKCCVCAFKEDLCNGDFCEKYYREGNTEDFEKLLPHWIPCSERLPDMTALVTVETKVCKNRYVCEAVWIPRWSKKRNTIVGKIAPNTMRTMTNTMFSKDGMSVSITGTSILTLELRTM